MLRQIRPAIVILILITVLTGGVYPLVVTGIAKAAFPHQAGGSLTDADGKPTTDPAKAAGSSLIGQGFDDNKYFWGRLSATSPVPYTAFSSDSSFSGSGGTNFGPLNSSLTDAVKARVDALRKGDPTATGPVPVDLVTASGSGLDPDISPAAAEFQVHRVAAARGISDDKVRQLLARHTQGAQLGFLGEQRVNVLELNLELDRITSTR